MLSTRELESRILYAIIVAGKSAKFADAAFKRLFFIKDFTPFRIIKFWIEQGVFAERLRSARVGNYAKIERAYRELVIADLDLGTCTPEDLEKIHGIGPKTSRFFVLWTRPTERYAVLDVHVLRWMQAQGFTVPSATPSQPRYGQIEKQFLDYVDKLGMTPRQVDEIVWMKGSGFKTYNPVNLGA